MPPVSPKTRRARRASRVTILTDSDDEQEHQPQFQQQQHPTQPRRSRGLSFLRHHSVGRGGGNYAEYEQKYPADEYGAEMGPTARVWRVYLEEAEQYDSEMIEGFKDTTDVLLVYAGLFSAVVTTFVVQSAQALQPNYQEIMTSLMAEMVQLQRAAANGTPIAEIPFSKLNPSSDTTSELDRWINSLWFISLFLSLVVALLAVLIKEWLQHYISALSGTPRDRVLVRHFRFMGFINWKVPTIISVLPMLLHLALFLFLAGLGLSTFQFKSRTNEFIISVGGIMLVLYMVATILPWARVDCPFKSPLTDLIVYFLQLGRRVFGHVFGKFRYEGSPLSLKELERIQANSNIDEIIARALAWLHLTSSNPTGERVVAKSISGLPFGFSSAKVLWNSGVRGTVQDEVKPYIAAGDEKGFNRAEVLIRSLLMTEALGDTMVPLNDPYIDLDWEGITTQTKAVLIPTTEARFTPSVLHLVIQMVVDDVRLPPRTWQMLFSLPLEPASLEKEDKLELLIMLLRPLSSVPEQSRYEGTAGLWKLPPSVSLGELCGMGWSPFFFILSFACNNLLEGDVQRMVLSLLRRPPYAFHRDEILIRVVLFILSVLTPSLHWDPDQTKLAFDNLESSLVSIIERLANSPASYIDETPESPTKVLDRFFEVSSLLENDPHVTFSRLFKVISATSPDENTTFPFPPQALKPALLYYLQTLDHPWPLRREALFADIRTAVDVFCRIIKSADDDMLFKVLDLGILRRSFGIDFDWGGEGGFRLNRLIRQKLIRYLQSQAYQSDSRRQLEEEVFQTENLGFLIWLSCLDPFMDFLTPLHRLRPHTHEPNWIDGCRQAGEMLHASVAQLGVDDFGYAYQVLYGFVRNELKVPDSVVQLWEYVSLAKGGDLSSSPEAMIDGMPVYGPLPVRYRGYFVKKSVTTVKRQSTMYSTASSSRVSVIRGSRKTKKVLKK